ncbi:MAG: hypothetical protein U0441_08540 [Polyangiaceae bacterium]
MMSRTLFPSLIASSFTLVTALALVSGCGGGSASSSTGGGGAATTTSAGGTGGAGGATTTTTTTTDNSCKLFCDHLASINCNILQDCENDCKNHLNAKADCVDEADALLACWEANQDQFVCTMTQVLPPDVCQPQEKAFNSCVKGDMIDTSCICSAGVGVGDGVNNCSRKTSCATAEFVQTCQKLAEGQPWTCSCFANGGLLGTCSEDAAFEHCSNMYGCCVPLFCAASGQ